MSWLAALRPASFAGIGFYWKLVRAQGGQRLVVHNFPLAPIDLENLGQLGDKFSLTAYFIGNAWLLEREAFIAVLAKTTGAATLILPTKGPLRVRVDTWSYQDSAELGNYGAVDVNFIIDAGTAGPFAGSDTVSSILSAITDMQSEIISTYEELAGPLTEVAAAAGYAQALLGSAVSAFLALPEAIIGGIISLFAATPTDAATTANVVTNALLTAADNASAALNPDSIAANAITGTLPATILPGDPTFGIANLANFGGTLAPAPMAPAALGQVQQAVTLLVEGAATVAVVSIYAQTDFASTQAAAQARTQIATMLEAVGIAAYNAGQVDLYRAWSGLESLSIADMVARAQGLPTLASYAERRALPDVVIAQRLYQDGTQGDALAALNNAVHPLFMPATGVWLEAA
jgi:prophage DNA circulation protein